MASRYRHRVLPGTWLLAALALLVLAACAVACPAAVDGPGVTEKARLLPVRTAWPGVGSIIVPGIHHTERTRVASENGRPVEIRYAVAEPRIVHSHSVDGDHPPRMALTFDDGPSATYTPRMLDIFAENRARCTFFVLGGLIGRHKQLLRRAEREGHEVGIHSWAHARYTGMSTAAIQGDIARCNSALAEVIDRPVRWVRPPYGAVNAHVRRAINDAGYHVAMWSVDPRDWQSPGSSVVARRILSKARDGAVVVLHDGGRNRAGTVAAMRQVVPELKARGYELVTLSELAGLSEPAPSENGLYLTIDDRQYEVVADYDDVTVTVDGSPVELGDQPVKINDQFLVHARPVLAALGARVVWDQEALAVSFDGKRGEFVIKLNSLDATLDGEELLVQIPSVYYHGTAMLPVWLIANACGATVQWDGENRVIELISDTRQCIEPRSHAHDIIRGSGGIGNALICRWSDALVHSFLFSGDLSPAAI